MKAIMVMYDSLNRHMLRPYGCDWVHAPNFRRLAERSATFTRSYVCSMPCMPARRDLHTGRPNFLHRSWGPLEPFDDSVPQMLKLSGIYTHLVTDHQHYFEDGGGNYHTRYSTWEFHRGQEGDAWIGQVADEPADETRWAGRNIAADGMHRQDRINRKSMPGDAQMPQTRTFQAGLDFIRHNADQDRWFLQIETFDPHEPFFTDRKYQDLYAEKLAGYKGKRCDWPPYAPITEDAELVEYIRLQNAALISMCDARLGDVLDLMDQQDLWDDTMLIVWTDHGFLLGEHDCWAKGWMPYYEEVSHTPLFVWDPRSPQAAGQQRHALVQPSIDLGPTLLDYFGQSPSADMTGKPLRHAIAEDGPVREAGLFGIHGGQVNVTDGRYVYMRGFDPDDNGPLHEYTLMPAHMRSRFSVGELCGNVKLRGPFRFTKGCPVMKIACQGRRSMRHPDISRTLLFDLATDPHQQAPIRDDAIEQKMVEHLVALLEEADAPPEQFERLRLPAAVGPL